MSYTLTSPDPQTARIIVCDYMHWSGSCSKILTPSEHDEIYSLANGYGNIGREALDMHYDWSHVRDSTDDAWVRMALRIQELLRERREVTA